MSGNIEWVRTHCSRMDHGGCSLLVRVKDNRIVKIKGDPNGFLNKGYICPKALALPERLNHPLRLKHPLKRAGNRGEGRWKRISWPEALNEIKDNFQKIKERYTPKAVAFGQGMPKGLELFALIRLANAFGSPNVVAVQDVCHAPREITGVHTCGFYPVVDFHHKSRLMVIWASNPPSTNEEGQVCSLLFKQIREGTELVVIDPRRTALAERAKLWLQLRPGTDNALALAFLNVIIGEKLYNRAFVEQWTHGFDELAAHVRNFTPEKISEITWVDPDLIREAARFYALSHPAAIQWGNPIEQNAHTFDTVRAIICLMAICGNLDVPGGNIQANEPEILSLGKFARADLLPAKRKEMIHAFHNTIPRMMTVPPAYFRKAVLEDTPYAVRGAYFQGANPLLSYAESRLTLNALEKLDFLAVSDIFMTPTALLADIVLPAATTFEFNDIGHYGLGHGYILARPKVVDPPEECWPDLKIINELGKLLTSPELWYEDYEGLIQEVLRPSGLSYAEFVEKGYLHGPERFRKYLSSGFRTPSTKVEISLSLARKFGLPALPNFSGLLEEDDPAYPLILTSCKSRYYLHSSYRWLETLRKYRPKPKTEIHPVTAAKHGIEEGDEVIIETRNGSIVQHAHLTDRIHPRVINTAYGWWFPEAGAASFYEWEKSNYNMLTSSENLGQAFGTPNLKGIGCRIKPIR
ncbi:MAG: molybdopterin-dependent oxidoreductase [Deltaproteobacteria bacterium]|nr:molybdopterin-dependent oxidoreductase [Deltaproteobacteria bacterium]MBW1935903.1 molybdopterin-dependent oxidoreductase [Deltaproteobacteria bacterium]MBW1977808.1 molybdopterin-dependent oxidoreductase [Deltaproteobacteria bacterium]MBW2044390.1 molybdopterin-dependent oxidoreductase [Deltaproteobacteria bacterium]MBW2301076.1 molybdopterin-dependent oxidoreductase [Deltaproteobacteria bacterium]